MECTLTNGTFWSVTIPILEVSSRQWGLDHFSTMACPGHLCSFTYAVSWLISAVEADYSFPKNPLCCWLHWPTQIFTCCQSFSLFFTSKHTVSSSLSANRWVASDVTPASLDMQDIKWWSAKLTMKWWCERTKHFTKRQKKVALGPFTAM